MCGIVGFLGFFPVEKIYEMNSYIAHRGPDDEGYFISQKYNLALGHRRLSIIDLSPDAKQPLFNENKSICTIFNGEIYNYQELKSILTSKGHKFYSHTDGEVIVHLYEEYGENFVNKLNGIFSIALWDENKQALYLFRDFLGVKPLYYTTTPRGIIFASELKALLCFPDLDKQISYETIHHHLSFIWSAPTQTMFKNVHKLPAGHSLQYTITNQVLLKKYYDIPYQGLYTNKSYKNLCEELQDILLRTIKRQTTSDVPVAAFLSGGVDSSTVVAMMKQNGQNPVCYTISHKRKSQEICKDLPYARAVAKHLQVELREINIQPNILNFTKKMVYLLDEPQADPACINLHLICEQAKKDGFKVMMSGTGGDDIFSGYRRHLALYLEKYWHWLPVSARQLLAYSANNIKPTNSFLRRLQKYFRYAHLSKRERLLNYFVWHPQKMVINLYSSDVKKILVDKNSLEYLNLSLNNISREKDSLNRMLYLEQKHFLPDHNLNYTDKMSMAHGVEVRVPFLDIEMIHFASKLSTKHKMKNGVLKSILKDTMKNYLPHHILHRKKMGFGAPLRDWIVNDLRDLVYETLSKSSIEKRNIFDAQKIHQLILDNEAKKLDASYLIFSLMCIELWMQTFLDNAK